MCYRCVRSLSAQPNKTNDNEWQSIHTQIQKKFSIEYACFFTSNPSKYAKKKVNWLKWKWLKLCEKVFVGSSLSMCAGCRSVAQLSGRKRHTSQQVHTDYSLLMSNNKTKASCWMYWIPLLLLRVTRWLQVWEVSVCSGWHLAVTGTTCGWKDRQGTWIYFLAESVISNIIHWVIQT